MLPLSVVRCRKAARSGLLPPHAQHEGLRRSIRRVSPAPAAAAGRYAMKFGRRRGAALCSEAVRQSSLVAPLPRESALAAFAIPSVRGFGLALPNALGNQVQARGGNGIGS